MKIIAPACSHYGNHDNSDLCYFCDVEEKCKQLTNLREEQKNEINNVEQNSCN